MSWGQQYYVSIDIKDTLRKTTLPITVCLSNKVNSKSSNNFPTCRVDLLEEVTNSHHLLGVTIRAMVEDRHLQLVAISSHIINRPVYHQEDIDKHLIIQ